MNYPPPAESGWPDEQNNLPETFFQNNEKIPENPPWQRESLEKYFLQHLP